jgi:hypothetical protein
MKHCLRLMFALLVLTLTAGPLVAAPVSVGSTPLISAPSSSHSTAGGVLKLLGYGLGAIGAIRIRDTASLAKKYTTRAGAAAGDYKDGVQGAGADWEANTKASEANYEQGVQAAIGRKAFGRGVGNAGGAKYTQRAVLLGSQRYGPGVNAGADDWAKNTQPYLQALSSMQLPPKGPRRSPANQQRASIVANTLGMMKEKGV